MNKVSGFSVKLKVCVVLQLTLIGTTLAGDDSEINLRVDLSLSKSTIKPCEKIDVEVTVTNIDSQFEATIPAVMADPYYWLRIELISPIGKVLGYEGPEFQTVGIEDTVTLFPNYYFGTHLSLTCDSYNFRELGEYKIRVVYGYGPTDRKTLRNIVRSGEHAFMVSE